MEALLSLRPGQNGTRKLAERFGSGNSPWASRVDRYMLLLLNLKAKQ